MADYIPKSDVGMNAWQAHAIEIIESNLIPWGIPSGPFSLLKAKQKIWTEAFSIAVNRHNRTSADVQAKDDAFDDYVNTFRSFVAEFLKNNSKIEDSDRVRMGISVKSTNHPLTPIPASSPLASVDFSTRLQHKINFYDKDSSGSKAKPEGVHGCEIYLKLGGEEPISDSELTYLGTATATPYIINFKREDAGKRAHYWLRWVNTRGKSGPWGSPVSEMVVG
jgi:hypothetical protein